MDDVGTAVDATAEDAGRLRTAGLRATRPRLRVLRWLEANDGHHAADSIVAATGLPKATAYHVLGQLGRAGLLLIAEAGSGRILYEAATAPHHHFLCVACGAIIDVPCVVGSTPCLDVEVPGALVEQADVLLKGRCLTCA